MKIAAVAANPAFLITLPGKSPVAGQDSVSIPISDSGNFDYGIKVATADGSQSKTYSLGVSKGTDRTSELATINITPTASSSLPISPPFSGMHRDLVVRWKDSVVSVMGHPITPWATVFYNGIPLPFLKGYPIHIAQTQSTDLTLVSVAQDGVTKSTYYLKFTRYPPMGEPRVLGPSAGFKDSLYKFYLGVPSGCSNATPSYIMDFGDGTEPVKCPVLMPQFNYIQRAYTATGTYAIKVRALCNADTSVWSPPYPITIYDPADNPKVRPITGPRSASETWSKDTTYLITGKSLFEKGTTLTILPGTHVVFMDTENYLMILGGLSAVGTSTDSIHFERANLRIRWKSTSSTSGTYNPDGSYLAGPRLEYCSLPNGYIYIDRNDSAGGWGPYLKNSRVQTITGETLKYCSWSYFDHCRIDTLSGLRLMKSQVLNSYITSAEIIADKGTPVTIQKCDINHLRFGVYDFTTSDISGNTIRRVSLGSSSPGKIRGNNFLQYPPTAIRSGTGSWDMKGNFWGETATAEMAAKGSNQNLGIFYDYLDDVGLGKLDYSEWKTDPILDAQPDWQ